MRKFLIIPLAVAALSLVSCGNAFTAAAAVVDGTRIASADVENEVKIQLDNPQVQAFLEQDPAGRLTIARNVLQGFIGRVVVRKEAARLGIRIAPSTVTGQVEQLRLQLGGDAVVRERVKAQGWTYHEFLERVHDQALSEALRQKLAKVDEQTVRDEYKSQRASFSEVRLRDILIKIEQRSANRARSIAAAARARIAGGESFASVARDVSEDPTTKRNGGAHAGYVLISALEAQDQGLGAAVEQAKLRSVSRPVRTASGYHVIMVVAKRIQSFEKAAPALREQLAQTIGVRAIEDILKEGQARARIIVNPRYGDWDPKTGTIIAHEFFEPPTVTPNEPPGQGLFTPAPVAPPGGAPAGP